jgi:hypothetical protein
VKLLPIQKEKKRILLVLVGAKPFFNTIVHLVQNSEMLPWHISFELICLSYVLKKNK